MCSLWVARSRDLLRAERIGAIARGPVVVLVELGIVRGAERRRDPVCPRGARRCRGCGAARGGRGSAPRGVGRFPPPPRDARRRGRARRRAPTWGQRRAPGIRRARCRLRARAEDQQAAVRAERDRIASDLHDSLAQDLAIIAVHAQRLEGEFGMEHPLALASRGALAASRGVIADLAAAEAPTVETALRQVAAELAARFGVTVVVRVGDASGGPGANGHDFATADREQLVRIARLTHRDRGSAWPRPGNHRVPGALAPASSRGQRRRMRYQRLDG